MRKIIMRIKIDDEEFSIRKKMMEIRKELFKREISFRGVFIEVKSKIAYVWR